MGADLLLAKLAGWEIAAGREASANRTARWALERLLDVERPGGRGRRLLVLARWAGEQPVTRLPWDDEWISISMMTEDRT